MGTTLSLSEREETVLKVTDDYDEHVRNLDEQKITMQSDLQVKEISLQSMTKELVSMKQQYEELLSTIKGYSNLKDRIDDKDSIITELNEMMNKVSIAYDALGKELAAANIEIESLTDSKVDLEVEISKMQILTANQAEELHKREKKVIC